MAPQRGADPYVNNIYNIDLEHEGESVGKFGKISGGSMEITVIPYTLNISNGASQGIVMPGATSFEPITLSRGVSDRMDFWEWWLDMANGYGKGRVNLSLFAYGPMLDTGSRRAAQWDLEFAWPSKISGFTFGLGNASVFVYSVTMVVENIVRVDVTNPRDYSTGYDL